MKRLVRVIALSFLAVGIAGAVYNFAANRHLQSRNFIPGTSYLVNGHRMHLYCTGSGNPTVVLDSGLGDDWLIWQKVQPVLSTFTRACSYDRAGLGWSDPQPGPHGALTISEQLGELLDKAQVPRPIILVGHSAGGLYARAFASKYPAQVSGLVLVDTSSPEAFHAFPDRRERDMLREARHRKAFWLWLYAVTGLQRLSGECDGKTRKGLEEYASLARTEACRPSFVNGWLGEWDYFEDSADEVAKLSCCGNLPMLVISRDPEFLEPDADPKRNAVWDSVQENLKRLSTRSIRIVARNSGHYVMIDRPDLITNNVRQLVFEIRGLTQQSDFGKTVVQ